MQKRRILLAQLLGTYTKARIIEHLIMEPSPITRHALSRTISGGTGPTYSQVDQLIALGVLRETDGKIELDPAFPFYDDLANLVVSTSHYMDDHRTLFGRIDSLFVNNYYITGYTAACQNGPPIDYEQNSILVAALKSINRWKNYLKTLSEVSTIELDWFFVDSIPKDIKREKIFESEIWIASIERGIVDCVVRRDCDLYPAVLLLLQNISEGNIDGKTLISIANENRMHKLLLNMIFEINEIMGKEYLHLTNAEIKIAKVGRTPKISNIVKKAYNTLMGG